MESNEAPIINDMQHRLLKCFLDLIVLSQLEKAPMSGYDVITFVQNQFGIMLSPGTAYATLYQLERDRYVISQLRERKRMYTSTEKGKQTIQALTREIDKLQNFLYQLLKR